MHLLMLGLDSSARHPHGNTDTRHVDTRAHRQISVIDYTAATDPKPTRPLRPPDRLPTTSARRTCSPGRLSPGRAQPPPQRADLITTQTHATGLIGLWLKRAAAPPANAQATAISSRTRTGSGAPPAQPRAAAIGNFVASGPTASRAVRREKGDLRAARLDPRRITVLERPPMWAASAAGPRIGWARCAPRWASARTRRSAVCRVPSPAKNATCRLEAFARVRHRYPAARLVMAGDFSQRPNFRQRAEAQSVIFPGLVSYTDLPAYYQLAEVYVHSSRYEGIARVLMEALAAGTPVASTAHLGADEVVRPGETGLLTDHTPDALAGAVIALLDDPQPRAMGE